MVFANVSRKMFDFFFKPELSLHSMVFVLSSNWGMKNKIFKSSDLGRWSFQHTVVLERLFHCRAGAFVMKSTPKAVPVSPGANQSVSWPFQEPPVPAWVAGLGTAVLNHGKVI